MKVCCFLSTLLILFASANVTDRWLPFFARCIYLHVQAASYDDSRQICLSKGASLFIIKNQKEKDNISKMINKHQSYRVGYSRKTPKANWQWEDKSTFFDQQWWRPGDPHWKDTTAYLYFDQSKKRYTFDGHIMTKHISFICQKDPWRILDDTERVGVCGVELMPNCDGLSCESVCEKYPGCSSFARFKNACVNIKKKSEDEGNCRINLPYQADVYAAVCQQNKTIGR